MLISSRIKQILLSFILIFIPSFATFANELSFVIITDLHLNLNKKSATELAPKRQNHNSDLDLNTYQNLLHSINNNIEHGALQKSQFVLVLGDLVSHDRVRNSVEKTEATALQLLVKHFPQQPIFYVFGNNDAIKRNYGTFQHRTKSPFSIARNDANWHNGFLSSATVCAKHNFPCLDNQNNTNGYYAAQLSSGLKLIALNSVMFSAINKPSAACDQQLNWLEQQLHSAQQHKQQVIIAMHIPPGLNTYNNEAFWQPEAQHKFVKLIQNHSKIIKAILAGHTHQDDIKIMHTASQDIPIFINPALSTAYGNAAGLKLFTFKRAAKTWNLENYSTFKITKQNDSMQLVKVYDFKSLYCPKNIVPIAECLKNVNIQTIKKYMTAGNPNYQSTVCCPKNIYLTG